MYINWDEFSFWGTSVKLVKLSGEMYTTAEIGWELGSYSSKSPSVGYIAMFLNYGAVRGGAENRKTRRGQNRGKLQARQFIERAKKAAKPKVKRQMKKIIEEVNEN
jgi:hypothetical protein